MKKLILIDLSGIFRANWHSSEDQEIGAAYSKTITKVWALVAGYDYVAICVDRPPYARKKLFDGYKAHREAPPPQMVEQFTRVKERLEQDAMLLWGVQGFEADDIIATAVALASDDELDITIASSDKDLMCLVSDARNVRQLSIASGALFDEKGVFEKFGVPPVLMPELLALMGDSSDGIPGIEGVGPKTAAALLKQFGSLEDALSFPDQIKTPKLRESVAKGATNARLALKLVTLDTTAPIKFSEIYERREPKTLTKAKGFDEAEFEDEPSSRPEQDSSGSAGSAEGNQAPETPKRDKSQSIELRPEPPKEWALQLEPGTTRDAWTMAVKLHDSRVFSQFNNANAIFAVMLRGRSLGIDAVTSLSNFHIIEGRPAMHAALIVGLVLKSGKAEYFDLIETTNENAKWVTKRKGSSREVVLDWTIEDALNAGLLTGTPEKAFGVSKSGKPSNWDKYRRTMLRWRAATELARAVYPDVTTGIYTPDELAEGVYDPEIEARHAE